MGERICIRLHCSLVGVGAEVRLWRRLAIRYWNEDDHKKLGKTYDSVN
jgi:hypothetical protein